MDDRAKAGPPAVTWAAEIAAAIDWWQGAGVDCDFAAEPVRWLAPPETAAAKATAPQRARAGGDPSRSDASPPEARGSRPRGDSESAATPAPPTVDRSQWPQDLAAFTAWWLTDPALDGGRTSGRVPPRGKAGADVMVIVPDPERDDADRLLSGPQGKLLDAMLAAMGIAPEETYLASVLPRHMPMPDWAALTDKGFGALLCHHVKLARPRRLVALGSSILPLLGHDPAHSPAVLREFNHEGLTIPLLAGKALAALLERPRWKAGLWQGWLDWTQGRPGQG